MEGLCLYLVIAYFVAGSVRSHEANSLYSGCQWNNVHFLNCRSTGITTLGDLFFLDQTTNVTSSNYLRRCPRTTKHIDLSYNMMSALYINVFYKFVSLETLSITNNQIYKVSMNIQLEKRAFLTSLQALVLNGNRLIAIPKGLCKLKSLQTLSLSANRILHIQRDDFANCTKLQHVDLGENRISSIHPDAFQDLRNLQVLKLHSNTLVSLSPLVFLFIHVLKAHIDLSDNLWACDCNLQPLKYLISSVSTGTTKPWNVTCRTPFSKAGQHIISIENSKSCHTADHSYVYDKTLIITAGVEASLDCESSNQLRNKDVLWWTPHGIISKERQDANHYLSNTNRLFLDQPDYSDEGLYLCLTNAARIAYQVDIHGNNLTIIRRSPRDLQLKNAQLQTQNSFDLAVSLSVVLTFLIAFFLGVFIRPYLESLWKEWYKPRNTETQRSDAVYENEGFTADYTTRKHSVNSNVSSLPKHKRRQTFENPDTYYLEAENITMTQERAIDVENPSYNAVQEMKEDTNELADRFPKTKRVTWAPTEDLSLNVNLKYLMSLLKPINFTVLDSSMVQDHQSLTTHSEDTDNISGHYKNITMSDESYSSDEGSSFSLGSEYDISDDDSIITTVLQNTKNGRQDCNDNISMTVNLKQLISLLKPVHIIVQEVKSPMQNQLFPLNLSTYPENRIENRDNVLRNDLQSSKDTEVPCESHSSSSINMYKKNKDPSKTFNTSSSDEGSIYSFDSEYELSHKDKIVNSNVLGTKKGKKANNENSPTVNLNYVMSFFKPINIIVPESTTPNIVKSPKQKKFFPLTMYEHPENRMENSEHFHHNHYQDKIITRDEYEPQLHNIPGIHYTDVLNDSSSSDEDSNISVNSEDYLSAEDAYHTKLVNETPTVNLRDVISLLKPISITIPDSTMPKVIRTYPGNQDLDPNKVIKVTQLVYDGNSSESSSSDTDDSDKAVIGGSILNKPLPRKWVSNENIYPTVNLRQAISTLKPIQIKVPNVSHYSDTLISPKEDFDAGSQKLYYYSSSDEQLNDSVDSDHVSSDEYVPKNSGLPVPTPRKKVDTEKYYPTVNLKYIISSFKPIHINIPDSIHCSDALVTPKKDTEFIQNQYASSSFESSDDSAGSEYEGSNTEVIISPIVSRPTQTKWTNDEDLIPFVNLKYIMLSLKPMKITIPDTTHYWDLPMNTDKNKEIRLFDSSSSDENLNGSANSNHHSSAEFGTSSSTLPIPTPRKRASSKKVCPTVNLKHIISSLKPIRIYIPDSAHLSDTLVTPKNDIEFLKTLYDSDSFESSNDSADSEHEGSGEEMIMSPYVSKPMPTGLPKLSSTERPSSEDFYPTVNLKQIMCSLKPIQIKAPEDDFSDPSMSLKMSTEVTIPHLCDQISSSESSNGSVDLEYDGSDDDVRSQPNLSEAMPAHCEGSKNVYPTVNLKYVISLLKPFHVNVPDSTHYSDTHVSPKKNIELTQDLYDSTSSDESSNYPFDSKYESSDEEVIGTPAYFAPKETEWANNEDLAPTVNLKQVISLLKPIKINIPDTTHHSNVLVKNDTEVTQKVCEFSSSDTAESESSNQSDDSEYEGSDEEVIQKIKLLEPITELKNLDYSTSTVNLKHVMSSLKPIHITVPDTVHYSSTGSKPNIYTKDYHELDDSTSSDESFNESFDLKLEDSHKNLIKKSTLPKLAAAEWVANEILHPTVNLKHVISSLKPIQIKVPDSTQYSDAIISPKKNIEDTIHKLNDYSSFDESSNDSVDSDHDSSDEDVKKASLREVIPNKLESKTIPDPTVNLKNTISFIKPLHFTVSESTENMGFLINPKEETNVTQKMYIVSNESFHDSVSSDEDIKSDSHIMKAAEITPKPYDFNSTDEDSNESSDLEHEGSAEDNIRSDILPQPTFKESANNENVYVTVNLKHIISSLKPICFAVPDSTHYLGPHVNSRKNMEEFTQNLYDNISSDEHSNESSDSSHEGSEKEVIRYLPKSPITDWESNTNLTATFNLKHALCSFKPICIAVEDSYNMTTWVPLKLHNDSTPDESSNSSADSDSEHENSCEHLIRSPLPKPGPDTPHFSDILLRPKKNMEITTQKLSDYNSSDDEKLGSTVNLRHIISTFKPFNISVPDSTKNSGTLRSPSYPGSFIIPMKNVEASQKLIDNSSSDESSSESGHEGSYEVTNQRRHNNSSLDEDSSDDYSQEHILLVKHSTLPNGTPREWARKEKLSPTVNFRHISLLKPIKFKIQDSLDRSDPLKGNIEVTQEEYNSSRDDSSTDSEHEDQNEYVIMPQFIPTERAGNENASLTVNFKHVISTLKPINIRVPESKEYEDTFQTPQKNIEVTLKTDKDISLSNEHLSYLADLEYEGSDKYMLTSTEWATNKDVHPTVNLKHLISLLKPIQINIPDSIYYSDTEVTAKKHFDNHLSDGSSKDFGDSEPTLKEWECSVMAYPTVNLKNVTSLLKPLSVKVPDSEVPKAVKMPTWKPFFLNSSSTYKENQTDDFAKYSFSQPKSQLLTKNYTHHHSYTFRDPKEGTNVTLTSYKKMSSNNTSDNIGEWGHKGENKGGITNSDLLKLKLAAETSPEDDAPKVNLRHVMSLIKPVSIIAPELPMTKLVKHPPPIPPRKSRKNLQEQSSSSSQEKPMTAPKNYHRLI